MSVRKTESRIPANLQASDLGEAVVADDLRCTLVSFITAPLAVARTNVYVALVTDAALASATNSFEWTFTEDTAPPVIKTTDFGQIEYTPAAEGYLQLKLRLLDAASSEQASLSLIQQIGPLNAELESMIADAANKPGPALGNAAVLRELVNDHNPYYQNVTLQTSESGDGFKKLLFNMVHDGALTRDVAKRNHQLNQVADSLNTGEPGFVTASAIGLGVAGLRLVLAAMLLPPNSIPFAELPEPAPRNAFADEQLREQFMTMSEAERIDLFNLVRFPKSNITLCGKVLEALRDKLFSGVNFNDVLTKGGGTMADWLTLNYRKGPLPRS